MPRLTEALEPPLFPLLLLLLPGSGVGVGVGATTAGVVGVRPIDWQNRPTFQQVVAFERHRPR